jgi:allophanate hydrolase subunit 2
VGLRLLGVPLSLARTDELPSEGLVLGAVQVPPDGHPVVFLADHPTTGGYPVVAVVDEADLWQCAQLRPGETVRFTRAARR